MAMAWQVGSPPLRRAKSDTQAAGERGRDSQRPAVRLRSHSSVIWFSYSSILKTDRSTMPPNEYTDQYITHLKNHRLRKIYLFEQRVVQLNVEAPQRPARRKETTDTRINNPRVGQVRFPSYLFNVCA